MTNDQRNAAIKAMLKQHAKTVTVSKKAARQFLVSGGFYTKEGLLTSKYGGGKKKSA